MRQGSEQRTGALVEATCIAIEQHQRAGNTSLSALGRFQQRGLIDAVSRSLRGSANHVRRLERA